MACPSASTPTTSAVCESANTPTENPLPLRRPKRPPVDHPTEGRSFYLHDALGSIVGQTTDGGSLLGQYSYDAWGNRRHAVDNASSVFGFTGHETDAESGLIYARARFYDPEIGRFLSHDPVEGDPSNPPSLHRYLYAYQNPTVWIDPTGMSGEKAFEDKYSDSLRVDFRPERRKRSRFDWDLEDDTVDGQPSVYSHPNLRTTRAA